MGEGYDDAACRAHLSGVISLSASCGTGGQDAREAEKQECLEVEKASMANLSLAHSAHTIALRTVKIEVWRNTVPHSFAQLVSGRPTTGRTKLERMKKSTLQCATLLL